MPQSLSKAIEQAHAYQKEKAFPKENVFPYQKTGDMSDQDYLVALLHLGSALEHALLVQYLYAAYSIGGPQVPQRCHKQVRRWRDTILTVAREEMGHLLTVQNALIFMGASLELSRDNFPWNVDWFDLEPLTKGSLACYIVTEMPAGRDFKDKKQIQKLADQHMAQKSPGKVITIASVGLVYEKIIELLASDKCIPDDRLRPETYPFQASWDEWGRQYRPDPRLLEPDGSLPKAQSHPHGREHDRAIVMVDRMATRTEALNALKALSVQGEGVRGPHKQGRHQEEELCHFDRFLKIYLEWKDTKGKWLPTRAVVTNPTTVANEPKNPPGYISNDHTREWGNLFKLRYRLLLQFLGHTFFMTDDGDRNQPSVRAMLMHRVFGEMYHLKTIAEILVELPLTADKKGKRAGPTFDLPYTRTLPASEKDRWKLHLDTIAHADEIAKTLSAQDPAPAQRSYLEALQDLNRQTSEWINRILSAAPAAERAFL